jgi:hypothetical protein
VAGEEDESGLSVADEVDERLVGCDGEFGFGRAGNVEAKCGGCGGDSALFVHRDVGGVDGAAEERVGADLGV